jgi:Uncharacterised nucleotidyltransferase
MITSTQPINQVPTTVNRPEIELILCCARTRIDAKIAERIKTLLQQDMDWTYVIQTAASHAVMSLLYRSLNATCPEAVPKSILAQLQQYFHVNAIRNLFMARELLTLLDLFETHNIPAIAFKGPVLAASAYGNLALRQFGDLDILVKKQDFLKVIDLLSSQEYQTNSQRQWMLDNVLYRLYLQYSTHEYSLIRNDGRVVVDIHHRVIEMNFLPLDFAYLCKGLEPISLSERTVLNLHPENLLLILCVHGSKHRWERLQWVCDVAEFICAHPQIDWENLIKNAKTLGCERMLLMGLVMANNLLGVSLPESVHQRVQGDPESQSLAIQASQGLWLGSNDSTGGSILEEFRFNLRMLERPKDKLFYCVKFIFHRGFISLLWAIIPTVEERKFAALPQSLSFLYFLMRPFQLVMDKIRSKV